jgi:hypothetical protein
MSAFANRGGGATAVPPRAHPGTCAGNACAAPADALAALPSTRGSMAGSAMAAHASATPASGTARAFATGGGDAGRAAAGQRRTMRKKIAMATANIPQPKL